MDSNSLLTDIEVINGHLAMAYNGIKKVAGEAGAAYGEAAKAFLDSAEEANYCLVEARKRVHSLTVKISSTNKAKAKNYAD